MEHSIKEHVIDKIERFNLDKYAYASGSQKSRPLIDSCSHGFRGEAGVLIPIFILDGELMVLLTLRSEKLRNYSGEVSFPGGMRDDCDLNPIDTALRETYEEVGLPREWVHDRVGKLCPRMTRTKVLMHPVLGLVDPPSRSVTSQKPQMINDRFGDQSSRLTKSDHDVMDFTLLINEDEVDFAFMVPLKRFLTKKDCKWIQISKDPHSSMPFMYFFDDVVSPLSNKAGHSLEPESVTTFGITADICIWVAVILLDQLPEFPFFPQIEMVPLSPQRYWEVSERGLLWTLRMASKHQKSLKDQKAKL